MDLLDQHLPNAKVAELTRDVTPTFLRKRKILQSDCECWCSGARGIAGAGAAVPPAADARGIAGAGAAVPPAADANRGIAGAGATCEIAGGVWKSTFSPNGRKVTCNVCMLMQLGYL